MRRSALPRAAGTTLAATTLLACGSHAAIRTDTLLGPDGAAHVVQVTDHGCSPRTSIVVDSCRLQNVTCVGGRWGLVGETYGALYDSPDTLAAVAISSGAAGTGECILDDE